MCIRDRWEHRPHQDEHTQRERDALGPLKPIGERVVHALVSCLLYTSDAADERSSVDLGGRRIINKKKNKKKSKKKKKKRNLNNEWYIAAK